MTTGLIAECDGCGKRNDLVYPYTNKETNTGVFLCAVCFGRHERREWEMKNK